MLEEFRYTVNVTEQNTDLNRYVLTCESAMEACRGAHAIAVMTEWDEFTTYDYQAIFNVMAKPAFIFDGRNILNHKALAAIGFEVYAIGKPTAGVLY